VTHGLCSTALLSSGNLAKVLGFRRFCCCLPFCDYLPAPAVEGQFLGGINVVLLEFLEQTLIG
jgi:hypothetical protein